MFLSKTLLCHQNQTEFTLSVKNKLFLLSSLKLTRQSIKSVYVVLVDAQ